MSQLTITLTGRRPVSVETDEWPIIASSKDHDGQLECQADRTWKLTVRQCQTETSPGGEYRHIVYGVYSTCWQGESDRRGGQIVDDLDAVPAAVAAVADYLGMPDGLADRCVADLSPESL